jgi:protein tyrosine phosphatase (PTP) superfamily phosphohydrolase (DUF442 family)
MSIADIRNYIHLSEKIASSGQPEAHEFMGIAKAGYKLVVNLAMPDSDFAIQEEESIVTALGMSYVHIPVPFEAPTAEHLRQFLKVMQACSDQKVWVHCALNYRVSAFLYQYQRLVNGLPDEEAKKAMLETWEPDETWRAFIAMSGADIAL